MFQDAKKNLKIGKKEVLKLLSEGRAKKVYIAGDCEEVFKSAILNAANSAGVTVEYKDTMSALGAMCGIDVGASCAAEII